MFFIKLFRPKDIPNRKADWNWSVRFYRWTLVRLMPIYRRCAISDTVCIGEVQVIHNVRDYWYEQELQRFRIDTAQHLEKQSIPYSIKRKYRHSALFNWSESLLVFYEGRSYNIKRDKDYLIATDIEGVFKASTVKDVILRSEFTARLSESYRAKNQKAESLQDNRPLNIPKSESSSNRKISVWDSVPMKPSVEPQVSQYQGFEENDIF